MFSKDMLEIINNSYPDKTKDVGESISLLNLVLEELMNKIGQDITIALNKKNYDIVNNFSKLHEHINEMYLENDKIIEYIDSISSEYNDEEIANDLVDDEENTIPNYDNYKVDQSIPHTLYEDFEYKRPVRFKFQENIVQANSWYRVLLETCEILYKMDQKIFTSFILDKNMNGKKRNYFSLTKDNIRKPKKLEGGNVYIETNLSANSIKQIIIKMLKKYQIKLSDFVVYYRADYTELNKK